MKITDIRQKGAVISVYVQCKSGEPFNLLLSSDRHHDSFYTNRDLELKHLQLARERDALIIDVGDIFDAMQGRYDFRRDYADIRPEYCKPNYYDLIVDDAAEFYAPYADRFLVIAKGNHDKSVLKHTNIDLVNRLVYKMRQEYKATTLVGGYGGWVIFHFEHEAGGARIPFRMKFHHSGYASKAPVTRGVIGTNRQAVFLANPNLVANGHTHTDYITGIKREYVNHQDQVCFDMMYFVRTPGYKFDYGEGADGFPVEDNHAPNTTGCIMAELVYTISNGAKIDATISTKFD